MTTIRLIAKRTVLLSLVTIQMLFFPALSYADTAADQPATNDTFAASTTPESSAPPVTEAAPQSSSEATPATNETAFSQQEQETQSSTPVPVTIPETPSITEQQPENEVTADTTNVLPSTTIDTSVQVTNTIPSTATSGDASVLGNQLGGNATTGDTLGMVNLINLLQSQSNVLGNGNMLTFSADIQGDVIGDLLIDPDAILAVQNSATSLSNVKVTSAAGITNLVDLNANSGNATVGENRVGGDATSGNANAVVNIVNLLNSIVSAGGSFFGNINIYGDLEGDILLPPNFLASLLASNSVPTTTITVPVNSQLDANLSNSTAINNQITTTANSGDATVVDNRVGGDATTGQATTKITVLNLSSHQVVGVNTLLVFVNVQGEWVGLIMDAPGGATAAALGGGIAQNNVTQESNLDISSNQQINNVVNVNADSGNAAVTGNRVGGNATSGNASASANIANMANSQFSLSNWFGILFINVFGTWRGSFGVDTALGNPVVVNTSSPASPAAPVPQLFSFAPGGSTTSTHKTVTHAVYHTPAVGTRSSGNNNSSLGDSTQQATHTLGTTTENTALNNPLVRPQQVQDNGYSWAPTALGLAIAASLLAAERVLTITQRRRS